MTGQSRRAAMVEVATGTSVGLVGNWCITLVCIMHVQDPVAATTLVTVLATVWSLARGYWVRRFFDKYGRGL